VTKRASLLAVAVMAVCAFTAAPVGAQQSPPGRTVLVGGNAAHRAEYQAIIDGAAPFVKQAATQVMFRESNCPGVGSELAACVISSPRIDQPMRFYIPRQLRNARNYDPTDLRNTVLHELGHVYDFLSPTDGHRGAYMKIFNVRGRFYNNSARPPFEKFAVGYSYCAENLTPQEARKRRKFDFYDYRFSVDQYFALCAALKP
jgi:hypothetical protein